MSEWGEGQNRVPKMRAIEKIGSFLMELKAKGPNVRLDASDLQPDELEASAIPDGHVMSAQTKLKSHAGKTYTLSYSYIIHSGEPGLTHQQLGTTINVRSGDKPDEINMSDYEAVYEQIRKINNGFIFRSERFARGMTRGGSMVDTERDSGEFDPNLAIGLSHPPTQKQLAEAMRKYNEEFKDVSGMSVSYLEVGNKRARHTGLPAGKVKAIEESKATE